MGIISSIKDSKERYKKIQAERKGYRKIISQKTKLAARQAYADEAIKVARERAKARAREPTFGQKLSKFAEKQASSQRRRVKKRVPIKQKTNKKKKKKTSTYPIYSAPKSPQSLNQAIYGGY